MNTIEIKMELHEIKTLVDQGALNAKEVWTSSDLIKNTGMSYSKLTKLTSSKIYKHCLFLANTIQNSGKSTFLRFFVPTKLMNYLSEDIGLDKDSRIKLCKNLIINLDELSILARTDINSLKAYISKTRINERFPYARKAEFLERISAS